DEHGQARVRCELLDVLPRDGLRHPGERLERRYAAAAERADLELRRDREACAEVALPAAENRRVDREHERGEPVLDSLPDELTGHALVAKHIELKPPHR